jgi:outer membrane protein OmpA-like peptidoglycan-associated protein
MRSILAGVEFSKLLTSRMIKSPLLSLLYVIFIQCAFAQSTFIPKDLGTLNSPYDEINPVLAPDGKTLYFTRKNHPENTFGTKNSADIWTSLRQADGTWGAPQRSTTLNIGQRSFILSVTEDGRQLLIYNDEGLAIAVNDGQSWKAPQKTGLKASADAALSADGRTVIFSKGSKLYFSERKDNSAWSKPQQVQGLETGKIITPCLLADGTLYYASTRKGKSLDLFKVKRTGTGWNEWSTPEPLTDIINTAAIENGLHTNPNGAWGYFSSTRNASGKADLFTVKLYEDRPYVLVTGKIVNAVTKRPLYGKDATILVDGKPTQDFVVNRDSATYQVRLPFGKAYSVSAAVGHYKAISYPVDASADREFAQRSLDLEQGPEPYVLLKGKLLIKNTDRIIPLSAKPVIVVDGVNADSAQIGANGEYSLKLKHGTYYYVNVVANRFESFPKMVDLKETDGYEEIIVDLQADAEKMAIVTGRIVDQKTRQPLSSTIPMKVQVEGIESLAAGIDSLQGNYELRLPLKAKYVISAAAPGYYPVCEIIDVTKETDEISRSKDLTVVPVERGQSIRLNTVTFEPRKTAVDKASYPELDSLAAFLQENPKVKIEIGGHTDNVTKLSTLNMAKAVMTYLTSKGISPHRISARGYGSTRPFAPNKTAEGKALNRRMEFTIVEK